MNILKINKNKNSNLTYNKHIRLAESSIQIENLIFNNESYRPANEHAFLKTKN